MKLYRVKKLIISSKNSLMYLNAFAFVESVLRTYSMERVSSDKQLLKSGSGNNKRLYIYRWITSVIMRNVRINFMYKLHSVLEIEQCFNLIFNWILNFR